jgi:hypothetical protein
VDSMDMIAKLHSIFSVEGHVLNTQGNALKAKFHYLTSH